MPLREPTGTKSESDLCMLEKQNELKLYQEKIKLIEEQLSQCNNTLCQIKHIENVNVDNIADSLLHHVDDKTNYKNGILFMKNSIKNVLNSEKFDH